MPRRTFIADSPDRLSMNISMIVCYLCAERDPDRFARGRVSASAVGAARRALQCGCELAMRTLKRAARRPVLRFTDEQRSQAKQLFLGGRKTVLGCRSRAGAGSRPARNDRTRGGKPAMVWQQAALKVAGLRASRGRGQGGQAGAPCGGTWPPPRRLRTGEYFVRGVCQPEQLQRAFALALCARCHRVRTTRIHSARNPESARRELHEQAHRFG